MTLTITRHSNPHQGGHIPSALAAPLSEDALLDEALRAVACGSEGLRALLCGAEDAGRRLERRLVIQHLLVRACRTRSRYLEAQACLSVIQRLRALGWSGMSPDEMLGLALGLQGAQDFSPTQAVLACLRAGGRAGAASTRPGWSCAQQAAATGILGIEMDLWWEAGLDPRQSTPEGESLIHLLLRPEAGRTLIPTGAGTWPAIIAIASRWTSSDWQRLDSDRRLPDLLAKSWNDLVGSYHGMIPEWDARTILARADAEAMAQALETLPTPAADGSTGRL